jgi:hypothetical protein
MSEIKSGACVVKPVRGSTLGRRREMAVIFMVKFFQRQIRFPGRLRRGVDQGLTGEVFAISSAVEGGISNSPCSQPRR